MSAVLALPSRWRDGLPALRAALAAILSFALSAAAGLPESYWAALSALIVARPQPGASAQAGAERLAGTVAGAGLACLMALGRLWHLPELLLLAAAVAPLALLAAWREGLRTAPIAAVIVLSAQSAGHGAIAPALLRVAEITLGAAVGIATAWTLFPAHSAREATALARAVRDHLIAALAAAAGTSMTARRSRRRPGRSCASSSAW